jgi:hypothetical protein
VLRVLVPAFPNEPAELFVREVLIRVYLVGVTARLLEQLVVVLGVEMDSILAIEPAHRVHLAC